MKVVLPVQRKEIDNGKLKVVKGEFEAELDFSLGSQIRFEQKFPELASKEDLCTYSERIRTYSLSVGKILSVLKAVYCWFDTDLPFVEFVKLFDLTDKEYINKLLKTLDDTFNIIFSSSAEKN